MFFAPKILTNKSRLPEVYEFRLKAWENSPGKIFINRENFPNGWYDNLDHNAIHWIIEEDGQIIASARIALIYDLNEMDEDFSSFSIPDIRPFAFYSRLAIDARFRKMGVASILDKARLQYLNTEKIPFALAYTTSKRLSHMQNLGFQLLGTGLIAKNVTPIVNEFRDYALILRLI